MGSGLTLTNNEGKCIKVIKSLENRGTLLKGTSEKAINQKEGFTSNVPWLLTRAALSLMKNVFTSLTKNVLIALGLCQQHQQQMQLFKIKFMDQESLH